ncbi:SCP2 sterol-binding domain-containing protein [Calidifontimicrobium sp. SYSU G02091]|uniref:SCP2 sterol-binding domain-containing protein n=1 Tax=Calidifontimicrobium sp. SYSU G02091 TaxID=2926421 RepID=UPI001F53AEA8|nr:SCP2 sterol-binding domain-containing protein [Calidifontimicrobium sp. SYSU G02091]MCI1192833.1 SCP2 sterol-binding domain-containing protein [Calidifontimicrobium sp. SYSU G02091]
MDLQACTETLRARVGEASGLGATLKFDCGDAGVVFIDGRSIPNTVSNEDRDADCTVGVTLEHLTAMLAGELEPATAFMTGKLRVQGDMSVALKLQRVL